MGYIRHNAIVVTTIEDWIAPIHEKAVEICGTLVGPLVHSHINGYSSFFVAPDGSKEGWQDSNDGDDRRKRLIAHLRECRQSGNGWPEWAEIAYGSDDCTAAVTAHAWDSQETGDRT